MRTEKIKELLGVAAALLLAGCVTFGPDEDINGSGTGGNLSDGPSVEMEILCGGSSAELPPYSKGRLTTRALINSETTVATKANFLRIDEDLALDDNGLYTFTSSNDPASSPYYKSVNWYDSYLLEATLMSSPDKDMIRSAFLDPAQTYKMRIHTDEMDVADTLDFYHTRMVGWYPMNCGDGEGKAPICKVGEVYSSVVSESVDASGNGQVSVQFHNLDGQTDVMVSDMLEGQFWHSPDASPSDTHYHSNYAPAGHPTLAEGTYIYAPPFGRHSQERVMGPNGETLQWAIDYDNHFTYKHYLSAVRIYAHAEQSPQILSMWGDIENVVIQNQPTSVKITLPYEKGIHGVAYDWDNFENFNIATGRIFGEGDTNSDDAVSVTYPISLKTAAADATIYLGYALICPDHELEIQLHTTSGVYMVKIPPYVEDEHGNMVDILHASNIYDIVLDLKTNGTVAALLEKEENLRYYDLTRLTIYEHPEEGEEDLAIFRYANTYVVSPDHTPKVDEEGRYVVDAGGNPVYDQYDGYCFSATTIGNGQSGIISHGTQTLYPTSASISPYSARLLWESKLGLVTHVEYIYGYVRFRVPDRTARGNAVIAVYDKEGKVLWSWHIWITDPPQDRVYENGENDIILLDRNLGATRERWTGAGDALDTYGLYYQWGRKDPSMGPPSYNYSITDLITAPYWDYSSRERTAAEVTQFARPTTRDGVEHPMFLILPTAQQQAYYFNWIYERNDILWGYYPEDGAIFKTIYDPCPFGYRVPMQSEMATVFRNAASSRTDYGQVVNSGGNQIYFPYAGYKGVDRDLQSLVLSWNYVGQKGDYMTATISKNNTETFAGHPTLDHRGRVYLTKVNTWEETQNTGDYAYTNTDTEGRYRVLDYANRRTAASVRCVKNFSVGSIGALLTASQDWYIPGSEIKLTCEAVSSENQISTATLTVESIDTGLTKTIYQTLPGNVESIQPMWMREESFIVGVLGGEFWSESYKFTLTCYNSHGVKAEATTTINYHDHPLTIDLSQWNNDDIDAGEMHNLTTYTRRFVVNTASQADTPADVTVQYHDAGSLVPVEPTRISSVGTAHTYEFSFRMEDYGEKTFTITAVCRELDVHTATINHHTLFYEKELYNLDYYFRPVNSRWFYWAGESVVFDWWASSPNGNLEEVSLIYDYNTELGNAGSTTNDAGSTIWSSEPKTPSVGSSGDPEQYTFSSTFVNNDKDGLLQARMTFRDEYGKTATQDHSCYIIRADYEGWDGTKKPNQNFTLGIVISGGAEPNGTGVNAVINGNTVSFVKDNSYTGTSGRYSDTRWTATLSLPVGTYNNIPLTLTFWDGTLTTTAPSIRVADNEPLTVSISTNRNYAFVGDKSQNLTINYSVSSPNGNLQSIVIKENGATLTTITPNNRTSQTGTYTYTPSTSKLGTRTFTIEATDVTGMSDVTSTSTTSAEVTVYRVRQMTDTTFTANGTYLIENQSYENYYLYDAGSTVEATATLSPEAFVTFTATGATQTFRFASGHYASGGTSNGGNVSATESSGTTYTLTYTGNNYFSYYRIYQDGGQDFYWQQDSATNVLTRRNSHNERNWNIYSVTTN